MRVVVLVLAAAPVIFAQTATPARPSAPARPRTPARPARPATPAGPAVPATPARAGFAPNYIAGYYPAPYPYAPAVPPPDPNAPPAYFGADPSGQGYPSILVNPNYTPQTANPVMRDYSYLPPDGDAPDQSAQQSSVVFLIAMKNHVIYPAVAYWVENGTLNYISRQGARSQVPLTDVDRDFSTQLNKERNIDFALPSVTTN